MVLAIYVGFSRLNHLRFVAQDPMLTGVLQVGELPPQCTFWRFLTGLAADGGSATVETAAPLAGTGLGSGQRAAAFDHSGYRYDRAHSLRPADGRAQELQPGSTKCSNWIVHDGRPRIEIPPA